MWKSESTKGLLPAMVSYEAYQRAIVAVLGSEEDDDLPVHEQVQYSTKVPRYSTNAGLRAQDRTHVRG